VPLLHYSGVHTGATLNAVSAGLIAGSAGIPARKRAPSGARQNRPSDYVHRLG
jgi:hypothetical protein